MMKKWIVITALLLSISCITVQATQTSEIPQAMQPMSVSEQSFADVPQSHWAFTAIQEMTKRGVLSGYPDGTFRPDNTVTRAEFAKIMVGAAGLKTSNSTSSSFADISITDWSNPFVETAKNYMTYYLNQEGRAVFYPDSGAIREDIAVALVILKGYDSRKFDLSILQAMFTDYDSISEQTRKYVALAVESELMTGYPDESFRAQGTITRAEAATLLWRAYQYGNDNKVVDGQPSDGPTSEPEIPVVPEMPDTSSPEPPKVVDGQPSDGPASEPEIPVVPEMPDTSSPEPPEVSQSFKYKTETLAKVTGAESFVIDGDDSIYFLKNNTICKLTEGKVSVVANGNKDFLCEYDKEQAKQSAPNMMESDLIRAPFTFHVFEISGIRYDESLDDILVIGSYEYHSNEGNGSVENVAIWSLHQKSIVANHLYANHGYGNYPTGRYMAFQGNQLIFEITKQYGTYDSNYTYLMRANLTAGDMYQFSKVPYISTRYFSQSCASDLNSSYTMLWGEYSQNITIASYNLATSEFEESFVKSSTDSLLIDCIGVFDNKIYLWMEGSVYQMNSDGTMQCFIDGNEIDFRDMLPIQDVVAEFMLDSKGNLVFYDSTDMSIRRISAV